MLVHVHAHAVPQVHRGYAQLPLLYSLILLHSLIQLYSLPLLYSLILISMLLQPGFACPDVRPPRGYPNCAWPARRLYPPLHGHCHHHYPPPIVHVRGWVRTPIWLCIAARQHRPTRTRQHRVPARSLWAPPPREKERKRERVLPHEKERLRAGRLDLLAVVVQESFWGWRQHRGTATVT